MFCIFRNYVVAAKLIFSGSLVCLLVSLVILMWEIQISTHAVELELSDMEELSNDGKILNYLRGKFEKGAD
jgi:hypothetical protein